MNVLEQVLAAKRNLENRGATPTTLHCGGEFWKEINSAAVETLPPEKRKYATHITKLHGLKVIKEPSSPRMVDAWAVA